MRDMTQLNSAYGELAQAFAKIGHLGAAQQTLFWESRTMMPAGGAPSRGKVMATLTGLVAEMMQDQQLARLLDRAEGEELGNLDPWESANLREMRRRWRHETAIPIDLASQIAGLQSHVQIVWEKARATNDFGIYAEPVGQLLQLQMQAAQIRGDKFGLAPYDALLDAHEPGLSCADIDPVFDDLASFLPTLLQAVLDKQANQPECLPLPGPFAENQQDELSRKLAAMIGFDFDNGRLDQTLHPFASGVPGDIRITTRYDAHDLVTGMMATIHETGHAMYEAGLPADWHFQPVGDARGGALHESQALLMEMQAGRSSAFLPVLADMLRQSFGDDSEVWSTANILRHYRKVSPGFIRVDADEVTYPLHVILRYRIERAIMDGALEIAGIPDAWN